MTFLCLYVTPNYGIALVPLYKKSLLKNAIFSVQRSSSIFLFLCIKKYIKKLQYFQYKGVS